MRFEAKHQYLKALATRIGNYINICYSLAVRHQSYQCYILTSDSGICINQHTIGGGIKAVKVIHNVCNCDIYIPGNTVKVHSSEYKDYLIAFGLKEDNSIFRYGNSVYITLVNK